MSPSRPLVLSLSPFPSLSPSFLPLLLSISLSFPLALFSSSLALYLPSLPSHPFLSFPSLCLVRISRSPWRPPPCAPSHRPTTIPCNVTRSHSPHTISFQFVRPWPPPPTLYVQAARPKSPRPRAHRAAPSPCCPSMWRGQRAVHQILISRVRFWSGCQRLFVVSALI